MPPPPFVPLSKLTCDPVLIQNQTWWCTEEPRIRFELCSAGRWKIAICHLHFGGVFGAVFAIPSISYTWDYGPMSGLCFVLPKLTRATDAPAQGTAGVWTA